MRLFYKLIQAYLKYVTTPLNKLILKASKCKYGKNFHTRGMLTVLNYAGKNGISIGNDVNINSSKYANSLVGPSCTILKTNGEGKICIGNNVGISNSVIISASSITIKDNATIGAGVKIYDTDFHPKDAYARQHGNYGTKSMDVIIEEDAFIGAMSIILKGVRIGKCSVVGAGSLVSKNIPDGEVWGGNPAQFIKKL